MTQHIAEMVGSEIRFLTRLQTNKKNITMYNINNPSNWSWSKAFDEMEKTVNQAELNQQCIMILGNSETTEYKNLSKSNKDEVYNLLNQIL